MALDLTSPVFEDGDELPAEYTAEGDNVNPPMILSGIPEDCVSLVMVVEDADTDPKDKLHWMVWNLPPSTRMIQEGVLPEGAMEGYNDFGKVEYAGPTAGTGHRIHFKLYALDVELELEEDATKKHLEKEMAGHILDDVVVTVTT